MQSEMKLFLAKIVNLMKDENLFATQGGPIILAQVVYFFSLIWMVHHVTSSYYFKCITLFSNFVIMDCGILDLLLG